MPGENNFGDELTLEQLEALFGDSAVTPAAEEKEPPTNVEQQEQKPTEQQEDVTATQAFAKRLREKTDKAVAEERENIAKQFGYTSYAEMVSAQEKKKLEEKGYDAEELSPIINELVEKRLKDDPRMQKLAKYEQQEVEEYGKRELAELSKLTNGEIKTLEQVPQDVIDLWKSTGSLKKAYLQLHGEELITRARAAQSKGDTAHLRTNNGVTPESPNSRPLTAEEQEVWRLFNPNISQEELSKKRVPTK